MAILFGRKALGGAVRVVRNTAPGNYRRKESRIYVRAVNTYLPQSHGYFGINADDGERLYAKHLNYEQALTVRLHDE